MKEIKIYEIPSIDYVERIDDPRIGMIFYIADIDMYYSVKALKEINSYNTKGDKVIEYIISDYAEFGSGSGGGSGLTAQQLANIAKIPAIQSTVDALGTEELTTTAKTLKGAINEVFQDVDNGKTLIASAITGKGVTTSNTDTFQTMANNISSISSSDMVTDPYRTDRILVWEDDFNGSSLNTDNWEYEQGLIRNAEIQYYTTDSKNVYVENSNLVLHAIKENIEGYNGNNTTTFEWTSGSITSKHKQEFQYGRIEAKIKFPGGNGTFPAFWTVGNTYDFKYNLDGVNYGSKGEAWAKCGEIDIVEFYKKSVTSGVFINTSDANKELGRVFNNAYSDFISEYHIYSLEWTKDKIEFYIDDTLTSSFDITDDMYMLRMPHYIILNLALGAAGGTPSADATEFTMLVDWVRVYADKNINTLSNIQLSSENINIAKVGTSKQLRVTYTPETAFKKAVVWSTDDPGIAVVYGGNVYAKSLGQTNINATVNGITKSCIVTVGKPTIEVTSISLSKSSHTFYTLEDTLNLSVSYSPNNAEDKTTTWETTLSTVATVENGLVTSVGDGECDIIATCNNKTATCHITVNTQADTSYVAGYINDSNELVESDADYTSNEYIAVSSNTLKIYSTALRIGDRIVEYDKDRNFLSRNFIAPGNPNPYTSIYMCTNLNTAYVRPGVNTISGNSTADDYFNNLLITSVKGATYTYGYINNDGNIAPKVNNYVSDIYTEVKGRNIKVTTTSKFVTLRINEYDSNKNFLERSYSEANADGYTTFTLPIKNASTAFVKIGFELPGLNISYDEAVVDELFNNMVVEFV